MSAAELATQGLIWLLLLMTVSVLLAVCRLWLLATPYWHVQGVTCLLPQPTGTLMPCCPGTNVVQSKHGSCNVFLISFTLNIPAE